MNNQLIDWKSILLSFAGQFLKCVSLRDETDEKSVKCFFLDDKDIEKSGKTFEGINKITVTKSIVVCLDSNCCRYAIGMAKV